MSAGRSQASCRRCAHFRNDPAYLEAAFAGLASLSSAYGSVRGEDGLCLRHDRYLGAQSWCADFTGRDAAAVDPAAPLPQPSASGSVERVPGARAGPWERQACP